MPSSLMLGHDFDIVEGFPTVDLNTGANDGDWVSLKNNSRVGIFFTSGTGTGNDDPTVLVQQATTNAGGSVKVLNIVTGQVFKKQAATSLAAVTAWSSADCCIGSGSCAHKLTNLTAAEQSLMWWVEFRSSDLDVDNGFDHLRATVAGADLCNAQPGSLSYFVKTGYPSAPTDVVSSL